MAAGLPGGIEGRGFDMVVTLEIVQEKGIKERTTRSKESCLDSGRRYGLMD
jgi:hypothetical protein